MPRQRTHNKRCPQCDSRMAAKGNWMRRDGAKMCRYVCKYCGKTMSLPYPDSTHDRFNVRNPLKHCSDNEWRGWCIQMRIAWDEGWRMDA